jgi:hypothetical protein
MAGQSSIEFAVGLSTLALLGIGTLAIGTWQEAQRQVLVAARQSAFERNWTGVGIDSERSTRLHRLHFSDPGLAMPLTGEGLVGAIALEERPVARPLEGATGAAEGLLLRPLEVGVAGASGGFDPGGRGWAGSRVELRPRPMPFLPDPLRTLQPRLRGSMVLLDDGWSATGPSQVRQRAGALVPTRALASLQAVVRPLLLPLTLIEPSLAQFCPGLLDPDGVPADRLSASTTSQPSWNSCR